MNIFEKKWNESLKQQKQPLSVSGINHIGLLMGAAGKRCRFEAWKSFEGRPFPSYQDFMNEFGKCFSPLYTIPGEGWNPNYKITGQDETELKPSFDYIESVYNGLAGEGIYGKSFIETLNGYYTGIIGRVVERSRELLQPILKASPQPILKASPSLDYNKYLGKKYTDDEAKTIIREYFAKAPTDSTYQDFKDLIGLKLFHTEENKKYTWLVWKKWGKAPDCNPDFVRSLRKDGEYDNYKKYKNYVSYMNSARTKINQQPYDSGTGGRRHKYVSRHYGGNDIGVCTGTIKEPVFDWRAWKELNAKYFGHNMEILGRLEEFEEAAFYKLRNDRLNGADIFIDEIKKFFATNMLIPIAPLFSDLDTKKIISDLEMKITNWKTSSNLCDVQLQTNKSKYNLLDNTCNSNAAIEKSRYDTLQTDLSKNYTLNSTYDKYKADLVSKYNLLDNTCNNNVAIEKSKYNLLDNTCNNNAAIEKSRYATLQTDLSTNYTLNSTYDKYKSESISKYNLLDTTCNNNLDIERSRYDTLQTDLSENYLPVSTVQQDYLLNTTCNSKIGDEQTGYDILENNLNNELNQERERYSSFQQQCDNQLTDAQTKYSLLNDDLISNYMKTSVVKQDYIPSTEVESGFVMRDSIATKTDTINDDTKYVTKKLYDEKICSIQ
jgi:hypothetical protein